MLAGKPEYHCRVKALTQEAVALGTVLLEHRRKIRSEQTAESVAPTDMLPYHKLCEIAEWCSEKKLPPLNALAVNAQTLVPGDGYDAAPGSSEKNWWNEVKECINCDQYPATISN